LQNGRKAAIPNALSRLKSPGVASIGDTTGVLDQGMRSWGKPGNLGEPIVSLYHEVRRYTYDKTPGVRAGSPAPLTSSAARKAPTKTGTARYRVRTVKNERT